ncbi:Hypothetical predicted protein [Pelobates cultripes]|uniref:Uncharacterized protein n=1 Tax=Pelobates cultripes TaxID=61616 RepID=A0AAD1WCU7_PELCU|nr:Hypothetical predicted protein [Pelobates cultripes]
MDDEVRTTVRETLTNYFKENTHPDTGRTTIWEAHKSVIRGVLISIGAHKKKVGAERIRNILDGIATVELRHKLNFSDLDLRELLALRKDLATLITQQHFSMLQKSRRFFYEHSNKCGRLLAKMLKKRRGRFHIHKLRVGPTRHSEHPPEMAELFHAYYTELYNISEVAVPALHLQTAWRRWRRTSRPTYTRKSHWMWHPL